MSTIHLTVYGAEVKCASCINLPSAYETKEWLEAAIARKFPNEKIQYTYCDIYEPKTEEQKKYAEAIFADEYVYPLVTINGEVVGEGSPRLKKIYAKIEELLNKKETLS